MNLALSFAHGARAWQTHFAPGSRLPLIVLWLRRRPKGTVVNKIAQNYLKMILLHFVALSDIEHQQLYAKDFVITHCIIVVEIIMIHIHLLPFFFRKIKTAFLSLIFFFVLVCLCYHYVLSQIYLSKMPPLSKIRNRCFNFKF